MKPKTLIATLVLALAIGAPIAAFVEDLKMPQPVTSPGADVPFLGQVLSALESDQQELNSFAGANEWLNSPPLTARDLRGKVVLVDFWTYTCVNWLRTLPYVRSWAAKYRNQGLVVIGVHTPEFPFERDLSNVRRAVKGMQIDYPVAIDNDYAVWRGFGNQYWPAEYFIDSQGKVRHQQFGEGAYEQSEMLIQRLLREAGSAGVSSELVSVEGRGLEAPADWGDLRSPETYLGFQRAENFASPGGLVSSKPHVYAIPTHLRLNDWALFGDWTAKEGVVGLNQANGRIAYRFHARDLNLVMGPAITGGSVRFRVTIDGQPPGSARGLDVDEHGEGAVSEQRVYQLIRQSKPIVDRQFEIEFLAPGVEAFDFTFG